MSSELAGRTNSEYLAYFLIANKKIAIYVSPKY